MTSVANHRNLHPRVVGHLCIFAMLIGGHGNLETCTHCLKVISCANVTVLQTRPHWVHIEERVFSVLDVCARVSVK